MMRIEVPFSGKITKMTFFSIFLAKLRKRHVFWNFWKNYENDIFWILFFCDFQKKKTIFKEGLFFDTSKKNRRQKKSHSKKNCRPKKIAIQKNRHPKKIALQKNRRPKKSPSKISQLRAPVKKTITWNMEKWTLHSWHACTGRKKNENHYFYKGFNALSKWRGNIISSYFNKKNRTLIAYDYNICQIILTHTKKTLYQRFCIRVMTANCPFSPFWPNSKGNSWI